MNLLKVYINKIFSLFRYSVKKNKKIYELLVDNNLKRVHEIMYYMKRDA